MPYAPGIQNISGQLAAQGIMAGGQAYGNAINSIGNSVVDFMKREDERAKTVGAIQGFLNDPYYQQRVAADPTLSSTGEKIKAGKASLNEVQQFLGSLTTAGHARDQQMKQDQLTATINYNNALRDQAIAGAAATKAATAERERSNAIAGQLDKTILEFDDLEKLRNTQGLTDEQENRFNTLNENPFVTAARSGRAAGLDPLSSIKMFQNEEGIRQRSELARMTAETRQMQAELNAAKNVKYSAGQRRDFVIQGKKITAEWDGKEYIDINTGAPIYTTVETRDMMGNSVSQRGQLNPEIATQYGLKTARQTPSGGLPGAGGGSENQGESNYEEVANPNTAQKDMAPKKYPVPNSDAEAYLLQNPGLSEKFDLIYGPGAAAAVLTKRGNLLKPVSTTRSSDVQFSPAAQFLPQ